MKNSEKLKKLSKALSTSPSVTSSNEECYACKRVGDFSDDCFIHQWQGYLKFYGKEVDPLFIFESVGPGWHNLLSNLFSKMRAAGWDGNVHQVKEKFGQLRVYIGEGNGKVHDLIWNVQSESGTICEECGDPGRCSGWGRGWVRTLCEKHGEEYREKGFQ